MQEMLYEIQNHIYDINVLLNLWYFINELQLSPSKPEIK